MFTGSAGRCDHRQGAGAGVAGPDDPRSEPRSARVPVAAHARRSSCPRSTRGATRSTTRCTDRCREVCSARRGTRSERPPISSPSSKPAGEEALLCGDGALRFASVLGRRRARRARRARRTRRRAWPRWPSSRSPGTSARNSAPPTTCYPCTCARAMPSSAGTERTDDVATAREADRAARGAHLADAPAPSARRCCGSRPRCIPTPWTHGLFVSELALRSTPFVRGRARRSRSDRVRRG